MYLDATNSIKSFEKRVNSAQTFLSHQYSGPNPRTKLNKKNIFSDHSKRIQFKKKKLLVIGNEAA